MTAARRGVARKVVAAVRCRYSSAIPATASTAASGPAPPAPIANSACCPAAPDNGGVRLGRLFRAIASAEYPAVHAAVTGELGERPLADQLAAADDHHLIGELLDFGQRMAGVQHGPADPGGRTQ